MLITGIWKLEQFEAYANGRRPKKPIAYGLLRHASEGPLGRALFECVIRDLQHSSGIVRTTYANRFTEVNELALELLRRKHAPGDALEVHDWAASDCLASYEFASELFEAFPGARVTASDISFHLICARNRRTGVEFVFEENGRALQYVKPPFVLPLSRPAPRFRFVNQVLRRRALTKVDEAAEAVRTGADDWQITRVPLVHPLPLAATEREPRFQIAVHSVFSRLETGADVIRTMNIFNRCYFSEEQVASGAAAVFGSLRTGGLWIVGRTTRETPSVRNAVTIYEKEPARFRQVAELNGGTEIAGIVEALEQEKQIVERGATGTSRSSICGT